MSTESSHFGGDLGCRGVQRVGSSDACDDSEFVCQRTSNIVPVTVLPSSTSSTSTEQSNSEDVSLSMPDCHRLPTERVSPGARGQYLAAHALPCDARSCSQYKPHNDIFSTKTEYGKSEISYDEVVQDQRRTKNPR